MKKFSWLVVGLIALVIGVGAAGFYSLSNVSVQNTYIIEEQNILEKDGTYYLLIDDRELVLSKESYDKIDFTLHNEYKVKYIYNRFKNDDGEVMMLKRYGEQPWGQE